MSYRNSPANMPMPPTSFQNALPIVICISLPGFFTKKSIEFFAHTTGIVQNMVVGLNRLKQPWTTAETKARLGARPKACGQRPFLKSRGQRLPGPADNVPRKFTIPSNGHRLANHHTHVERQHAPTHGGSTDDPIPNWLQFQREQATF
jgi:hypothetical protein